MQLRDRVAAPLSGAVGVSLEYGFMSSPASIQYRLAAVALGTLVTSIVPVSVLLVAAVLFVRSLGSTHVAGSLTIDDLLLMALVLRLGAEMLSARRLTITPASGWLLLFVVWIAATTLVGHTSLQPILRLALYAAVSVLLAAAPRPARRLVYGFFVAYAAVVLLLTLPAQLPGRLIGVGIGDPQLMSIVMFAGLAPLLGRADRYPFHRLLEVVFVTGIILTRTRGAWAALAVLLVISRFRRVSGARAAAVGLAMLAGGLLLVGPLTAAFDLNPQSKVIRQQSIERGVRAGMSSPVVGHGWNASLDDVVVSDAAVSDYVARTQPFNIWVSTWAFAGLPGVVLLAGFVVRMIRAMRQYDRSAFLFMVAFLSLSMVEMTLYAGSLGTVIFFIYAGLGQRDERPLQKSHASQEPIPALRAMSSVE